MKPDTETAFFPGPAGAIETRIDHPATRRGIALVCHPHPLLGGTHDNKVTQTLARTLARLDYVALRPNFRGVGGSSGSHDRGIGESEDMLCLLEAARRRFGDLPLVLAGFSFGAYVQTRVARALREAHRPAQRLILVGLATGTVANAHHYAAEAVPADSLVIHGANDVTVPLGNVLDWAQPLDLPLTVIPGADHFFHRRLHLLRDIVLRAWQGVTPSALG